MSYRFQDHHLIQKLEFDVMLLDVDQIWAQLKVTTVAQISAIFFHEQLDSTNRWLMTQAIEFNAQSGTVCLTEHQSAGRGCHGRRWISPYAQGIYLSLLWHFPLTPAQLGGLSVLCGLAAARVLAEIGIIDITLKWPNDLLWNHRKLGGVLVEVRKAGMNSSDAVIGIGINVQLNQADADVIDQPWTDLAHIPNANHCARETLIAQLIDQLVAAITVFTTEGLSPFLKEWATFDALRNKEVILKFGDQSIRGQALGINHFGALQLNVDGVVNSYAAGEVRLTRFAAT